MHTSWIRAGRPGLTLAAGMLALAGCGPLRPGTAANIPVPARTLPATSALPPTSAPASLPPRTLSMPPRPFSMPLNEVDPCRLLGATARAGLGFDRGPLPDPNGAQTCSFRNTHVKVGARLALITTVGLAMWADDTPQVSTTPVLIADFPALVVQTPGLNLACTVKVDVADGQHLDVLYRDDGAQPPAPLGQFCAGAQRVAQAAVTTLARDGASSETSTASTSSSAQPVG